MVDKDKIKEIVKQKFIDYLTVNHCRRTPERFAILEHIYSESGHFNMDSLYESMCDKKFRVSRATLYNTMQLLVNCKLVLKHQFGANISYYERAFNNEYHHHLICLDCGLVQEYKDNELKEIVQLKKVKNFIPIHYGLYIYGICNKCNAKRRKQKKLDKK